MQNQQLIINQTSPLTSNILMNSNPKKDELKFVPIDGHEHVG